MASNFAPALGQSQPIAQATNEYKDTSPHFTHIESLDALIGTIISQLFQAGAPFTDTLGQFRPVVISSSGVTINTSVNHPTGITLHDTVNVATVDPVFGMQGGLAPTIFPNVANTALQFGIVNAPTAAGVTRGFYVYTTTTTGNPRIQAVESTGTRNIYHQTFIARIKAGAPVDGDYDTPTDGMVVVDSTNNKIWARHGGAWHFAALT